jgi:hypothetical protein
LQRYLIFFTFTKLMIRYKFHICLLLFLSTFLKGQDTIPLVKGDSTLKLVVKKDSSVIKIKEVYWDSAMYRKYEKVFIVGVFSQWRQFNNEIKSLMGKDTLGLAKQSFVAESGSSSGLSLSYDKFQLSIGGKPKNNDTSNAKGHTQMFNVGLSFGDNRWVSESYYRQFVGFYNSSTPGYDTSFKETGKYDLQPNMSSSLFMTRVLYFTRYEDFSYKSGFGANYRQLKSAFTWIWGANYSTYTMLADSAIFPAKARYLFNDYGKLKGLRSYNLGITFGAAATIVVFKAWFINGSFTVGPEQQWRDYDLTGSHRKISYVAASGLGRFSAGLNLKKFYLIYSLSNDYNLYNSKGIMDFKSESITHNFGFGWRFHTGKIPGFYKKFMTTKFYKLFG